MKLRAVRSNLLGKAEIHETPFMNSELWHSHRGPRKPFVASLLDSVVCLVGFTYSTSIARVSDAVLRRGRANAKAA